MRVGLVVNPSAGRGRAARFESGLARQLEHHGHTVVDLTGHDAPTALANVRAEVGALGALVVVGGDGVVQLGLNAVAGTGVALGIVPVGSGNDNATGLGLAADPRAALEVIVHQLEHRPAGIPTDAMRVDSGGRTSWALGTLSCGIDAVVNARANELRWPQGALRYPVALFAVLPRYRNAEYRVDAGEWVWEGRAVVVAVANIGWFGGGMHIAPSARPDDGVLDVVIGGDIPRLRLLGLFPRIYGGTHVTHPEVDVRRASRVTITAAPARAAHADGEWVADLPVTVEVVPGAVRVLRPA